MSAQSPFLTDEEILSIAKPLKQAAAIVRWFQQNGFTDVKRRPSGMPLVARSYFDAVTMSSVRSQVSAAKNEPAAQPNIEAFRQKYGGGAKPRLVK